MSLLNLLDRIPLSRPHYALLLMGGARLHLRRDGRGHRRVPPPVGEDRVGTERLAELGVIGSATPFGFLFGR